MTKKKKHRKKKLKEAVLQKPDWVGDIDVSNCKPTLVYNIYQCRKCTIEYKEDHARKHRTKRLLLPGESKKRVVEVCLCDEPTPLLIKYKKCTCKAEFWGFYLREKKTCKLCSKYKTESTVTSIYKFYRLNEFYAESDQEDDFTDDEKWNCLNRNICLECSRVDGSKRLLGCLGCPHYEVSDL